MKITKLTSFIIVTILLCAVFSGCSKAPSLPQTSGASENTYSSNDFDTDVSSKHSNDTLNVSNDVSSFEKDDTDVSDISDNQPTINDEEKQQSTNNSNDDQSAIDDNKQPPTDPIETISVDDYSILQCNGKSYIVFDNVSLYEDGDNTEVASLDFESIKQFKDAVTKGTLADWEKTIIATSFPKNETGILSCDFNNLYSPILPSGSNVDAVSWIGESYSFIITVDEYVFGVVHCYSREQYDEIYQSEYENYFEKETITVTKEETVEGKTTTYYYTSVANLMQIRYSSTLEGKQFVIDKTYRLETDNVYSLTNVTMYCTDADQTYVVDLFGFIEEPDDSWLYEFGLTQYIENNNTVIK